MTLVPGVTGGVVEGLREGAQERFVLDISTRKSCGPEPLVWVYLTDSENCAF